MRLSKQLSKAFSVRDRKCKIRVCFPGARTRDVSDGIEVCMAGKGVKPIVCLSLGCNDVGRVRSEHLLQSFQDTFAESLVQGRDFCGL